MTCVLSPTGLIPWFSKTEGNTYATLLHHPFLLMGKPTSCSRGRSVVLVVEREQDGHKFPPQKPVYYISTVLTPCKSRYPHYQKIAYAVFMASRKLRHYFQECSITVASEVPLNDIINNRDATGRIAKWAIELLPFDITYKPC